MAYGHILKPASAKPGLADFLFAPRSSFSALKKPVAPFTNIGDSKKITQTHVLSPGFFRGYIIPERHSGKGDTVGTTGAQTLSNEFQVFVPGIDEKHLELVEKLLNEELITLHKDSDCANEKWFQMGDACRPVRMKAGYTTGTSEVTGEKGFILTFTWVGVPYVYTGTVSIAADNLS